MTQAAALSCLALAAGISLSSIGSAHELKGDIPSNAHYSAGGQGWACNSGFKQMAQLCVSDTHSAPSQSAFEVFNGQWRCRSGYQRADGFCVPLTAPAHATLSGGGDRWDCDWGFQRVGSHCEEIIPPAHGYLDASGHDWVCYPGFERSSDHCAALPGAAPASESAPPTRTEEPASTNDSHRPDDPPR
ncbi:MAG TPA: hypothetical protein VHB68_17835 [Steroidobacteraceae bacterium]|nr:hypothetical protein [Steroidobacteraceae bacterium]